MRTKITLDKNKQYCIAAMNRKTKERMDVTGPLSSVKVALWEPSHWDKKAYKYFCVASYPYYKEP